MQKCIYTSVVNAGRHTTFQTSNPSGAATPFDPTTTFRADYWLTKSAIQDAVSTTTGFSSWTILQPAFLLSNLVPPISRFYFQQLAAPPHIMRTAYTPMTKIPITDPVDIGKFAVKAFLSHELDGKVVPVVCLEAPTMDEIARTVSDVSGRQVRTEFVSEEEFQERRGRDMVVAAQGWARDGWLDVDMDQVREYGVEVGTLRGFLEREKEALGRAFDD